MAVLSAQATKRLLKDVLELKANPPEDIRLVLDESDLTNVQAWIKGAGHFVTRIFHPNVAGNGEICVNTLKKDWTSDLGLSHILITIRCLLIYPNPESALNEEAGMLLLERYEEFAKRARVMTGLHAAKCPHEFQRDQDHALSNSENSPALTNDVALPGQDQAKKKPLDARKRALKRL